MAQPVAKLAITIATHRPQTAVRLDIETVVFSPGDRHDIAGDDLFRRADVVRSAVAKLAKEIPTHDPQAAVGLEKQAVIKSSGNRDDVAGNDLLRRADIVRSP